MPSRLLLTQQARQHALAAEEKRWATVMEVKELLT